MGAQLCNALCFFGCVQVIRSDNTVKEAVEFLHKNNILSAPVLDVSKEHSNTWRDKYLGVLDVVKRTFALRVPMDANT